MLRFVWNQEKYKISLHCEAFTVYIVTFALCLKVIFIIQVFSLSYDVVAIRGTCLSTYCYPNPSIACFIREAGKQFNCFHLAP